MKTEIRFRGLEPSEILRDYVLRGIHFHLSRFGEEITSVQVRISDVNGPKGGLDKRCQVTVCGRRFARVMIEDLSGDAYSSVDTAVLRASRTVGRELEGVRAARRALSRLTRRAS